ncbi:NPC intracellular cholesterol transporter 2 homolog a-like [Malaya genurostris]|uniref:NPC intracellular cholesterol transporter 2 homolog a-like n=1 Tax=Malaya genurostris TaxID=325434 RepID=UPI0026F387D7|nr:NPC intracellular cholesterol transporter 2 homolog a-like [Malaya genurostris]
MFKLLILVVLVPAVMLQNADNIDYESWDVVPARSCANGQPSPKTVRIENCPAFPCNLPRGTDANMVMEFSAARDATNLNTTVLATALGITGPYQLPAERAAACNWLVQSRCPISSGEDLIYHLSMPITAIYPLVSVTIQIDIIDNTEQSQGCFIVDARVVAN